MSNKLTKQEKIIVGFALRYYRDDATTRDNGSVGLDRSSREYKTITSAIRKLQD